MLVKKDPMLYLSSN
jgi:hypothetical protein